MLTIGPDDARVYVRRRPAVIAQQFFTTMQTLPRNVTRLVSGQFVVNTPTETIPLKNGDYIVWYPDGRIITMHCNLFDKLFEEKPI